jgi:SAM-dependent methyltransferase
MISKEYESYIRRQSKKTRDPIKRKKWLGEEWELKINGFKKEFEKFKEFLTQNKKCLCLGARTGQEVVALKELGIKDVTGIDIVPCEPHVIKGDIHNLDFKDNTFDFVYTNIIDHSIDPKKMISEIERVLKVEGVFFLQIQLGLKQDEYTVFEINNPIYDVVTLFNKSFCLGIKPVNLDKKPNFAGMNVELIFKKDKKLTELHEKWGNLSSLTVPKEYIELWENINLPIQNKKLDNSKILEEEKRLDILSKLSKRAYYLTRIADIYESKNILEVGTAEGWQFFSFGEYAKEKNCLVISCDPRDVRDKAYTEHYQGTCYYFKDTSKFLGKSNQVNNIDLFYIDGLHDEGTVIEDVINLANKQSDKPVWIFDDFDTRFGCFNDIVKIISVSSGFKVWKIGLTASGQPSHQVMVNNRFKISEN